MRLIVSCVFTIGTVMLSGCAGMLGEPFRVPANDRIVGEGGTKLLRPQTLYCEDVWDIEEAHRLAVAGDMGAVNAMPRSHPCEVTPKGTWVRVSVLDSLQAEDGNFTKVRVRNAGRSGDAWVWPGTLAPLPQAPPRPATSFENETLGRRWQVVDRADTSVRRAVRYRYKVRVDGPLTEGQIRTISRQVIHSAPPHNGMDIFFYLPDSGIDRVYTAGKAEWWPNGRVGDAVNGSTGDYSRHRLTVEVGGAIRVNLPKATASVGVPVETRRRIFYELVQLEDQGIAPRKTRQIVARKFQLKETAVREIANEGLVRGWPMP
jgi:hypothetical protein